MEASSGVLLVSAVTVSLYQMSGTPFALNVIIFCLFLVICLYAAFISDCYLPSEKLFYWIYGKKKEKVDRRREAINVGSFFDETDDQITKKLREITGHIVRDFILSWYNTISKDITFVQEAFELFEHLLKSSRSRVSSVDREKLLADVLSNLLTHFDAYQEAEKTSGKRMHEARFQEDVKRLQQLVTISYCNNHGHHAMCHLPDSEMEYLRAVVLLLLKALLPTDYRLNGTEMYIVRELMAQNVFAPLVNLISDPLWIYTALVKILNESDSLKPQRDSERSEDDCEPASEDNCDDPEQKVEDTSNEDIDFLTSTFSHAQGPSRRDMNSTSMTATYSDDELSDSNPTLSISSTDRDFSSEYLPSDSFHSRISAESTPNDMTSSTLDEDLPLPMTSSLMHFAPDDDRSEAEDSSAQMLSSQKILKRQPKPRLFFRIRIPEALVTQEGFEGGGKYTLYRITYKTYRPVSSQVLNGTGSSPNENQSNGLSLSPHGSESTMPRAESNEIVQSTDRNCEMGETRHQVQRRFREFLVLQERLSQNMVARSLIADIKGPSRMFPVPFGNMDKEYVEQRRKFLQAYLRELCSIPFITHTKEMCEFLAYERDPRIAYVRKPDPLPRIDKILRSAVQDLFGGTTMKFSNTLQFDFDEEEADMGSELPKASVQKKGKNDVNVATGPVAKLRNMVLGSSHRFHKPESLVHSRSYGEFRVGRNLMPAHWASVHAIRLHATTPSSPVAGDFLTRTRGDGCDNPNSSMEGAQKDNISNYHSAVSLLFKIVFKAWHVKPSVHNLMVLSLTNYVRSYLSNKIDELTTHESWMLYLDVLRDSLWPDGKWSTDKDGKNTWTSAPDKVKKEVLFEARVALESALPDALRFLLGEKEYKSGVENLLLSFSYPVINRHLFYNLLDSLLYELFPDIVEVKNHLNISLNT